MSHTLYTREEYYEMFRIYIEFGGNPLLASNDYRIQFPLKERFPDYRVFDNLDLRMRLGSGSLIPVHHTKGRSSNNNLQELEFLIITTFQENPKFTIRPVAKLLLTYYSFVWRTLKKHGFHAYHTRRVQNLIPNRDYVNQIVFCNSINLQLVENQLFPFMILWTDECTFTNTGMFNSKNNVYWSQLGNPYAIREANFQNRWSINVWCGVIANQIVSSNV